MKKRGRTQKYRREFCSETTFLTIPIYKKRITETISPMPQEINEEEKASVSGGFGAQTSIFGFSLTKENRRKDVLKS